MTATSPASSASVATGRPAPNRRRRSSSRWLTHRSIVAASKSVALYSKEPHAALRVLQAEGEVEVRGAAPVVHAWPGSEGVVSSPLLAPSRSAARTSPGTGRVARGALRPQLRRPASRTASPGGVGVERRLADAAEERAERRVAVEVAAQDQGVDEEADQRLEVLWVAARDGRADRDEVVPRPRTGRAAPGSRSAGA